MGGVHPAQHGQVSDVYQFHAGDSPLLVSVPHDGWTIPSAIVQNMTGEARGIPDTDWHVSKLYDFVRDRGASLLSANFSRYVIDLNRPTDDAVMYEGQLSSGLCPRQTFAGSDIYAEEIEIATQLRIERFWQPYHDKLGATLSALRERHGYALLWDAHSIPSEVPALFDGQLPILNVGTWDGRSCDSAIEDAVMAAATASPYDAVLNARFKGGFITRHYGNPAEDVHAMQLELAQRAYMSERTLEYQEGKAAKLRDTLARLLDSFEETAAR